MSKKIKIGICGYGNIGRGVELSIAKNEDQELVAVFSRRNPQQVKILTKGVPVCSSAEIENWKDKIDVMIICGGSATDLPVQSPKMVSMFNIIDSFDNHAHIPEHFANVNAAALKSGKIGIISVGWDPGMFSLQRLFANCILPDGSDYTFWGRGVSQGHSDAIRRVPGVADARQYTVPVPEAMDAVRRGECPTLTARQKHTRECFVVAKEGADKAEIERQIKTMPDYFAPYDTTVYFISQAELDAKHKGIPHGGSVIRTGQTGVHSENKHVIEYSLKLDSNPEFTSSVLTAYARAAYRLNAKGESGAKTVFDIAPYLLSPLDEEYLRAHML